MAAKEAAFDEALPKLRKEYEKTKDDGGEEPTIGTFAFAYDGPPNAYRVKGGASLDDNASYRTNLISVRPGTYILRCGEGCWDRHVFLSRDGRIRCSGRSDR